jgi:hypothetical protein
MDNCKQELNEAEFEVYVKFSEFAGAMLDEIIAGFKEKGMSFKQMSDKELEELLIEKYRLAFSRQHLFLYGV